MAKLGTPVARWRREYKDSYGLECYTEYALRPDGSVVKKNASRDNDGRWHDWGWGLASKKKGHTVASIDASLVPKGYTRR